MLNRKKRVNHQPFLIIPKQKGSYESIQEKMIKLGCMKNLANRFIRECNFIPEEIDWNRSRIIFKDEIFAFFMVSHRGKISYGVKNKEGKQSARTFFKDNLLGELKNFEIYLIKWEEEQKRQITGKEVKSVELLMIGEKKVKIEKIIF